MGSRSRGTVKSKRSAIAPTYAVATMARFAATVAMRRWRSANGRSFSRQAAARSSAVGVSLESTVEVWGSVKDSSVVTDMAASIEQSPCP
jgi:hypothetical protein